MDDGNGGCSAVAERYSRACRFLEDNAALDGLRKMVAEGEAKLQEQKTLVDTLRAPIAAKKSDLSARRNDSKGKVSRATRLSHAAR
jgi:hypothetical protein